VFILRRGKLVRKLGTYASPTQVIVYPIKLSDLCVWVTEKGPPRVVNLNRGVPGVCSPFSLLKSLNLVGGAA